MTQDQALKILKSGANVFLSGSPGSGKTHTINEYVAYLRGSGIEPAITASTGIAATHVGGMTIHSWSGIGIKPSLNQYDIDRISTTEYVAKRILRTNVLIIDEVSMLGPDVLVSVDSICRAVKSKDEPFGGMQVILVGDFFQLPPIVTAIENIKDEFNQETLYSDAGDLVDEPKNMFAFSSRAWRDANLVVCYLTEQYRQDDEDFLSVLSAIRSDDFGEDHLRHIQNRKVDAKNFPENAPRLFSHNANVDMLNDSTLAKLAGGARSYQMLSSGKESLVSSLKKGCLSPEVLNLKVGAQVMFTKNNPREKFVNGTLGEVAGFDKTSGFPIVKTRNNLNIEVKPMDWSVEENGKIRASITQLPLRLAWAITVHKSQGMSLDEAVIDLARVFEYGQGYVALSRVRRLSGLYIIGWNRKAFEVHPLVLEKDNYFRTKSSEAEQAFAKLAEVELASIHKNFVIACGGKVLKPGEKIFVKGERLAKIRETYPNANRPWTKEKDEELKGLFLENMTIPELSKKFGRKYGAIRARLIKLGLIEETDFVE